MLGMPEAWKGAADGNKVFSMENSSYRNSRSEAKKPKKKSKSLNAT